MIALALAACGGGSGGGSADETSSQSSTPQSSTPQPAASNAVTVTIATGVQALANMPTVSVSICVPGTSSCQTVDNIQVDTESFGLRVLASALPSSIADALPAGSASGGTLAECVDFADGYMWGSVRTAGLKIGGEMATAVPIQIVGDASVSTVPQACQNLGVAQQTQSDIGANGILGIGVALNDCGEDCMLNAAASIYYSCPGGTNCSRTTVPAAQQVANPVARFVADNNGVILQLPTVPADGAASVNGTLIFGIGTQSNNALSAAQRFDAGPTGDFAATVNGQNVVTFLDSGSNGLYFNDGSVAQCGGDFAGFYCPASPLSFGVALTGADGSTGSVNFGLANAESLYSTGNLAFDNLGGTFGSAAVLDLGLPFFYGKTVFYGFDLSASGGSTPYVAF